MTWHATDEKEKIKSARQIEEEAKSHRVGVTHDRKRRKERRFNCHLLYVTQKIRNFMIN